MVYAECIIYIWFETFWKWYVYIDLIIWIGWSMNYIKNLPLLVPAGSRYIETCGRLISLIDKERHAFLAYKNEAPEHKTLFLNSGDEYLWMEDIYLWHTDMKLSK